MSTVFTSEKGRIIEIATIVPTPEAFTYVMFLWGCFEGDFIEWISQYVIMEDVVFDPKPIADSHFIAYAEGFSADPLGGEWARESETEVIGATVRCMGAQWALMIDPRYPDHLPLPEQGRGEKGEIEQGSFELARIEAGIPLSKKELSDLFHPLEAGLREFISFTKGCYVGQEVIARLDSYKKVSKVLARLEAAGPIKPGRLFIGPEEVGQVTSAVQAPGGGWIALGYVKQAAIGSPALRLEGQSDTVIIVRDRDPFGRAYGTVTP